MTQILVLPTHTIKSCWQTSSHLQNSNNVSQVTRAGVLQRHVAPAVPRGVSTRCGKVWSVNFVNILWKMWHFDYSPNILWNFGPFAKTTMNIKFLVLGLTRVGLIVSRNYRMPIYRDFQNIEEYIVSNLQYRVSRYSQNQWFFCLFFAENSPKIQKIPRKFRKPMNQSPQQQQQQQQQRRKFQKIAENSENSPKIP